MEALLARLTLLHDPHVVLWLTGPLLALAGVTAIARDEVFAGAALANAALLGTVAATTVPALFGIHHMGWLSHAELETVMAVVFAVATAFAFQAASARTRGSMNGAFGWTVLAAASTSCLLAAHHDRAPGELGDALTSAVVVAQPLYVVAFATALAGAAGLIAWARRKLVLLTIDPTMAEAVGMRVALWTIALPLALGVIVGLSVRTTGLLYTFGCLVLAPLAARSLCREIGRMFWVAPVLAAAASLLGSAAAARHGLPPAQLIVLVQSVLLVPAWAMRKSLDRGA